MGMPIRYDPFYCTRHWPHSIDRFERPARIFDQHFGMGLINEDLLDSSGGIGLGPRHMDRNFPLEKTGISEIQYDKDKWQVMLDVQHFKPEEINVNCTDVDNSITIHGHHEERQDEHGFISRSFNRRYILPEDVKIEHLECTLSSDAVLTLKAPRIIPLKDEERKIPIIQTGQPAIKQQPVSDKKTIKAVIKYESTKKDQQQPENVCADAAVPDKPIPTEQERLAKGSA